MSRYKKSLTSLLVAWVLGYVQLAIGYGSAPYWVSFVIGFAVGITLVQLAEWISR